MEREEILKKAIEKANKNGYKSKDSIDLLMLLEDAKTGYVADDLFFDSVIFNHDFAKAFWGGIRKSCSKCNSIKIKSSKDYYLEDKCLECESTDLIVHTGWEYHIQKLALAEDRLEYIGKFV